jgi:hypothetical protein
MSYAKPLYFDRYTSGGTIGPTGNTRTQKEIKILKTNI